MPHVKSKRVRAIATTGAKRLALLPDVWTLSEAGYKELEIIGWYCIVGPANLPQAIVERLEAAIRRAVDSPEFANPMKAEGTDPMSSTAEALRALMTADVARWRRIVEISGVRHER